MSTIVNIWTFTNASHPHQKLDHGLEDMQKYLSSIRSSLSKVNGQSDGKWTEPDWSSRPESRNSVASSTATNNSASFSNRASRSSTVSSDNSIHSTRSSLSLDDMDYQKVSSLPSEQTWRKRRKLMTIL
jgi:hypothetical protein